MKISVAAISVSLLILASVPAQAMSNCCIAHDGPGCDQAVVQEGVCETDEYCCDSVWDETCVDEVTEFGCGTCGVVPGCGDGDCAADEHCASCPQDCGGACVGDCCLANGSPGCKMLALAICVCEQDAYCCTDEWDDACVAEVDEFGCGQCAPEPYCGDGTCSAGETCSTCPDDCGQCQGTGDCCADNGTPGCDNPAIQNCVCQQDSFCCEDEWDDVCVGEVNDFGCGTCGANPGCGDGACGVDESCSICPEDCGPCGGTGDCCEEHEAPGCDDPEVQNCLCALDSFCCEKEWDMICVQEVTELGCGECGGSVTPGCGNDICDVDETCDLCPEDCGWCPSEGDCCTPNGTAGCDDVAVQNCVCEQDTWCCTVEWDFACANEVMSFECGECTGSTNCGDDICVAGETCQNCPEDCGACGGEGLCCEVHDSPGCEDGSVQACVCSQDSFCCEYVWDEVCVDGVTGFSCGTCDGSGPVCGNGECDGIEDCLVCPEDCGECAGTGCCDPHATPACDDAEIAACVCNEDAWCCTEEWDAICVEEVVTFNCGTCGGSGPVCGDGNCTGSETCTTCPADCGECPPLGACCEVHESAGCDNPSVQKCVCDEDAFCCETQWDEVCVEEVVTFNCGSCGACVPDCVGKACGGDGCGGSCGTCTSEQTCQEGLCVDAGGCQPDCSGLECGDDGCGGTCGTCAPGWKCHNGTCKEQVCEPDCHGKQCGPDGCGGSCGECPDNFFCTDGHCKKTCTPDCTGKQCGPDGCGGSCGTCPIDAYCTLEGHCAGDCQADCTGKQCGPDGCGGSCGSCPPGLMCNAQGHCSSDCHPSCAGKKCGNDGCGGTCGTCPDGQNCNLSGHCVSGCVPDCSGKQCGSDGCGGSCGSCPFGQACNAQGACAEACVPNCLGKECGDDGCGGTCGICGDGEACAEAGYCTACQPNCASKHCGPDGCGGSCGECPTPLICDDETHQCVDDGWGDGDVTSESDSDEYPCPAGQVLQFGNCIPSAGNQPVGGGGKKSGGCSAGGGSPSSVVVVLMLLALLVSMARGVRREG